MEKAETGYKADERLLSGNGEHEDEEESQEQLNAAYKTLDGLISEGSLTSITKQDLSLLKQILAASTEEYREHTMWRMCDFLDEDEAYDHVAAYYEAKDLGMDTGFNVAYTFALCSTNRKGIKNNLIAQMLDTLQHGKWAQSGVKGRSNGDKSPRSPLSP